MQKNVNLNVTWGMTLIGAVNVALTVKSIIDRDWTNTAISGVAALVLTWFIARDLRELGRRRSAE